MMRATIIIENGHPCGMPPACSLVRGTDAASQTAAKEQAFENRFVGCQDIRGHASVGSHSVHHSPDDLIKQLSDIGDTSAERSLA